MCRDIVCGFGNGEVFDRFEIWCFYIYVWCGVA